MPIRFSRDSWEWLMREADSIRRTARQSGESISEGDLVSDAVEYAVGDYGRCDWARYRSARIELGMDDFTRRFRHSAPRGEKYEAEIVFTTELVELDRKAAGRHVGLRLCGLRHREL